MWQFLCNTLVADPKLGNLRDSISESYRQLQAARKLRTDLVAKYAGTDYPNLQTDDDLQDSVNFIRMAGEAQTLALSANRPRFLVSSTERAHVGHADHFRRTLDTYAKRMGLQKPLQECALDGFFGLAIAKVCLHEWSWPDNAPREYATYGWPNVLRVGYDHFVYDVEAVDFEFCSFIGDRYRRRFDEVVNNPRFNPKARKEVERLGPESQGKVASDHWAEDMAMDGQLNNRFTNWVYMADLWIAEERKMKTYLVDHEFQFLVDTPLAEMEYTGKRKTGPYCMLNFGRVPDQTKCSSPAQQLMRLDDFVNTLYRKMIDQSRRQKNVFLVDPNEVDDGGRVKESHDGEYLIAHPNTVTPMKIDGPDQGLFALLMKVENQISKSAGNLDHKLGLGAQADTAAQESMISANVSRVDAAYGEKFVDFVRQIAHELARLLYYDAATSVPQTVEIPGASIGPLDDTWQPASMEERDNFDVLDVDIDPYSLAYRSPYQRAAMLRQDIMSFLPALEVLRQRGIEMDLAGAMEELALLENRPELRKLFKYNQPIPESGEQSPQRRSMPMPGQREYTHRSVSGNNGQSQQDRAMMEALSAARSN